MPSPVRVKGIASPRWVVIPPRISTWKFWVWPSLILMPGVNTRTG